MEEMEHAMESQQDPAAEQLSGEGAAEPFCISGITAHSKGQRADDAALTQCVLCMLLVLCVFSLHWLKPEWQTVLLERYAAYRDAPPVQWLETFLQAVQQWMQQ